MPTYFGAHLPCANTASAIVYLFRAFPERVFRGRKICALYFKICLTYFEICRTYFLFAPTWGLSAENQFSFFASKYPLFLACLFVPGISVSMRRTRTLRQFIQQPQKGAKPNEIKTLPLLTNGPAGLAKINIINIIQKFLVFIGNLLYLRRLRLSPCYHRNRAKNITQGAHLKNVIIKTKYHEITCFYFREMQPYDCFAYCGISNGMFRQSGRV